MRRVLVTGGTGFVGAWVVRGLVKRGHAVRVFDLRPNPAQLDFVEPGLAAAVECVANLPDLRSLRLSGRRAAGPARPRR